MTEKTLENEIRDLAYSKWENAGCPDIQVTKKEIAFGMKPNKKFYQLKKSRPRVAE